MNLYAESSAVIAWLFGEATGGQIRTELEDADLLISSDLTLIEIDRAIHRALALKALSEADATGLRGRLAEAARHWVMLRLTPAVVERARQPFPDEPIRTLDALHVGSALEARLAVPDLAILSLDARLRKVATGLGFAVRPS